MFKAPQVIDDTQLARIAQFTANLAQAAGTYDLCTASAGLIIDLNRLAMYMATAGATLTSVSIQTNQTNATTILSAAEGAVANLTAQKNVVRAVPTIGNLYLAAGQKIQFTIVGATGTGSMLVTIPYVPVVAGARLS